MSTLEDQLKREIEENGSGSPIAQMLRDQIQAQKSGRGFQSLYLEKESDTEQKSAKDGKKKKGNLTWLGWQTSAEDAPQPVAILYGRNLRR